MSLVKDASAISTLHLADCGASFSYDPVKWNLIAESSTVFKEVSDFAKKNGIPLKYLLINQRNEAVLLLGETRVKTSYNDVHEKMIAHTKKEISISDMDYDLRSVNGRVVLHYSYSKNENRNMWTINEYILTTENGAAFVVSSILQSGKTPAPEVMVAMNGIAAD